MKKKTTKKEVKVDWNRIITLSAAGHYIQDQLQKELSKIKQ